VLFSLRYGLVLKYYLHELRLRSVNQTLPKTAWPHKSEQRGELERPRKGWKMVEEATLCHDYEKEKWVYGLYATRPLSLFTSQLLGYIILVMWQLTARLTSRIKKSWCYNQKEERMTQSIAYRSKFVRAWEHSEITFLINKSWTNQLVDSPNN
jgi:hypothetical protein